MMIIDETRQVPMWLEYESPGDNNKYNFPSRNIVDYDSAAMIFIYSGEDTGEGRTVYTPYPRSRRNDGRKYNCDRGIRSMVHIKR